MVVLVLSPFVLDHGLEAFFVIDGGGVVRQVEVPEVGDEDADNFPGPVDGKVIKDDVGIG